MSPASIGPGNGTSEPHHRSSDEIERDIHATRQDLDRTLRAIEAELSPSHLIEQVVGYFKRSRGSAGDIIGQTASSIGNTVKENPVPLLLIGIGVATLYWGGSRSSSGSGTSEMTSELKGRASELKDRASELKGRASELKGRAGEVAQSVRDRARGVQATVRRDVYDQPLVLGALGVALGALLATEVKP